MIADPTDVRTILARVRDDGRSRDVRCPAHDDRRASLSVGRGDDGRMLLHCQAGCAVDAVLQAAGLTWADLRSPDAAPRAGIVATYDYVDESGVMLFQVVRKVPKDFRQRRRGADGTWTWNVNGVRRVLYRLPELAGQADVIVVEGEKDCDRLRQHGFTATTNPGGAGKWRPEYAAQLKAAGCRLAVILPDNDAKGETHGREVARACVDGGLDAKLIPLPALPPKGDVSDYLDGHTADDLRTIIADAPLFDPSHRVATPPSLTLATVADFLIESDDAHAWIVEDRIPAGAVVLFCGAPKAGKSTTVRELGADVACGTPWLGWSTTPGTVWLFAFEDQRNEVRRHLRQLGVAAAPLHLWVGRPPDDLLAQLRVRALDERPTLIIIDTLIHLLRADINDYSQVSVALAPWLELARSSGATLVLVHHASVHDSREGLHAILGSTALAGSVDNVLILRRVDGRRILSSIQRTGPDLEPTIIAVSAETGRLYCAGTKRIVEGQDLRDRMLEVLRDAGEPVRESWLHEHVDGRRIAKQQALRILLSQRAVTRTGRGSKGDPYLYQCSPENAGTHSGTGHDPSAHRGTRKSAAITSLFDASPDSGTRPPINSRVLELRTSVRTSSSTNDPILVPEGSETAQSDPAKTAKPHDKHGSDSGTQNRPGDDYERF